jgi:glycosyltransferase involved in cell wall biosynthesis
VQEVKPDHVYCQLIRTAEYARKLPYPKTLDYQDVFSKGIERRMKTSSFYLLPVLYLEHKRLLKYERRIFDCFDNKTIISKPDRDLIPHPDRGSISIVINGVDTDYFRPREVKKDIDVVFTGNMGYPPNVNAAEFLVKEIMPLVQIRYPDVTVALAGATPHPKLLALRSDRVIVTGWVDDMREYYARSKIFIAPMRIGTGLQNKLLEAMAMRLPCITSDLANQALQAEPGKQILTGSSAMELATDVICLLSDPELAGRIAEQGHRFVRGKYDWQAATAQLERIMISTPQKK